MPVTEQTLREAKQAGWTSREIVNMLRENRQDIAKQYDSWLTNGDSADQMLGRVIAIDKRKHTFEPPKPVQIGTVTNTFVPPKTPIDPRTVAVQGQVGELRTVGGEFGRGLSKVFTSLPKAQGIATALIQKHPIISELGAMVLPGAQPIVTQALMRGAFFGVQPAEKQPEFRIGAGIQKGIEQALPVTRYKGKKGFVLNTLPSGAGSLAGFVLGGIATGGIGAPAMIGTLSLGAATEGAQAYEEAVAKGASEDRAFASFLGGLGIGATEAVPIGRMFKRIDKFSGGKFKTALVGAIKGGTEEGIQEIFQQFAGNLNAKLLYDSSRDLKAGIGEGGAAGFFLGFTMNALGLSARRLRADSNTTPAEHDLLDRADEVIAQAEADLNNPERIAQQELTREISTGVSTGLQSISEAGGKFEAFSDEFHLSQGIESGKPSKFWTRVLPEWKRNAGTALARIAKADIEMQLAQANDPNFMTEFAEYYKAMKRGQPVAEPANPTVKDMYGVVTALAQKSINKDVVTDKESIVLQAEAELGLMSSMYSQNPQVSESAWRFVEKSLGRDRGTGKGIYEGIKQEALQGRVHDFVSILENPEAVKSFEESEGADVLQGMIASHKSYLEGRQTKLEAQDKLSAEQERELSRAKKGLAAIEAFRPSEVEVTPEQQARREKAQQVAEPSPTRQIAQQHELEQRIEQEATRLAQGEIQEQELVDNITQQVMDVLQQEQAAQAEVAEVKQRRTERPGREPPADIEGVVPPTLQELQQRDIQERAAVADRERQAIFERTATPRPLATGTTVVDADGNRHVLYQLGNEFLVTIPGSTQQIRVTDMMPAPGTLRGRVIEMPQLSFAEPQPGEPPVTVAEPPTEPIVTREQEIPPTVVPETPVVEQEVAGEVKPPEVVEEVAPAAADTFVFANKQYAMQDAPDEVLSAEVETIEGNYSENNTVTQTQVLAEAKRRGIKVIPINYGDKYNPKTMRIEGRRQGIGPRDRVVDVKVIGTTLPNGQIRTQAQVIIGAGDRGGGEGRILKESEQGKWAKSLDDIKPVAVPTKATQIEIVATDKIVAESKKAKPSPATVKKAHDNLDVSSMVQNLPQDTQDQFGDKTLSVVPDNGNYHLKYKDKQIGTFSTPEDATVVADLYVRRAEGETIGDDALDVIVLYRKATTPANLAEAVEEQGIKDDAIASIPANLTIVNQARTDAQTRVNELPIVTREPIVTSESQAIIDQFEVANTPGEVMKVWNDNRVAILSQNKTSDADRLTIKNAYEAAVEQNEMSIKDRLLAQEGFLKLPRLGSKAAASPHDWANRAINNMVDENSGEVTPPAGMPKDVADTWLKLRSGVWASSEGLLAKVAGDEGKALIETFKQVSDSSKIYNQEKRNLIEQHIIPLLGVHTGGAAALERIGIKTGRGARELPPLNTAELDAVQRYVSGTKTIQLNEQQQQLADAYDAIMEFYADWAIEHDMTVRTVEGGYVPWFQEFIENFWPQRLDYDNDAHWKKFVGEQFASHKAEIVDINKTAQARKDAGAKNVKFEKAKTDVEFERWLRQRRWVHGGRLMRNLELQRTGLDPEHRRDWNVILEYIDDFSQRRAEIEVFGKNDENIIGKMNSETGELEGGLINEIGEKYGANVKALAQRAFDTFTGNDVRVGEFDNAANTANRIGGAVNVLSLMGLSSLNQVAQVWNVPMRTSLTDSMQGMRVMFTKEGRQFAKDAAAALQDTIIEQGLLDKASLMEGKLSQRIARGFLESPAGLHFLQMDRLWRGVAANAGAIQAKKFANQLLSGKRGETPARLLREFGVDPDAIKQRGYMTDFEAKMAGRRVAMDTQFGGRSFEIPRGWRSPVIKFAFTTFKHFAFQQGRFFKNMTVRSVSEVRQGNWAPLGNFLGAIVGQIVAGELINQLKGILYRTDDERKIGTLEIARATGKLTEGDLDWDGFTAAMGAGMDTIAAASTAGIVWDMARNFIGKGGGPSRAIGALLAPSPHAITKAIAIPFALLGGNPKKAAKYALQLGVPQGLLLGKWLKGKKQQGFRI